ncbi:hypothetical protein EDC19_0880 [Natranaerovirga hydrolytica]|uniref:Aromatic acid exporter family member 1 n=1 Tax=Natranaerovirga hydrolytica TaxID=680378 RepID=A0A4R1MYR9_9FIRM|nr:aromatic acid exporter family protein [Natranaerovirga hydrolytica]TCK98458.1 hypothetical protein EDC19_0880 [Natranaerovirga hydrolytica]
MFVYQFIKLKEEAHLFDTKIYLLKTFVSVFTAYMIAINHPLLRLDMISILFGLMMTLEPVTISGIKSGFEQIYSTTIGAISTAVIISIFGINSITVALGVCFTLYICLRINWRTVSPVAIFTAIYMTQFVQTNALGEPSPILTFRLRIVALIFGVCIAIVYNFIFSLFAYKSLPTKRILYIINEQINIIKDIKMTLETQDISQLELIKEKVQEAFHNIDWIIKHINDMKNDFSMTRNKKENIEPYKEIAFYIRSINHINYDTCFYLEHYKFQLDNTIESNQLETINNLLSNAYNGLNKKKELDKVELKNTRKMNNRIKQNMDYMQNIALNICKLIREL